MGTRIAAALAVVVSCLVACKDDPLPLEMPPDTASPVDGTPVDGTPGVCGNSTVGFLQTCTDASECGTCECHLTIHALLCNKPCTSDAECPAPSRGCEGTTAGSYCRE